MKGHIKIDKSRNFGMFRIAAVKYVESVKIPALQAALDEFKKDVLDVSPSCPYDTGKLYDSHVTKIILGTMPIGVLKTENIPYALWVHEGIHGEAGGEIKYTRAGSGPKWLESKVHRFARKYFRIMQKRIFR